MKNFNPSSTLKSLLYSLLLIVLSISNLNAQSVGADNNFVSAQTVSSSSTLTIPNFEVPPRINGLLAVWIMYSGTVNISSVTFNGTETLTASYSGGDGGFGGNQKQFIYYLQAPTATTADILITLTSGTEIQAFAATFFNVDPSTPIGTTTTTAPNGISGTANYSTTISTSANNMLLDIVKGINTITLIPGTGQTSGGLLSNGKAGSYKVATGSSETIAWSSASDNIWRHNIVELNYDGTGSLAIIPTMGEWTLIIFGLIVLSLGVVYVMRWEQFHSRNFRKDLQISKKLF